jgi:predicted RNA binding protein YcfA (HicA-like mRNA interferase family)
MILPNPHGSQEIGIDLIRRIIRQAGIAWDEWDNA